MLEEQVEMAVNDQDKIPTNVKEEMLTKDKNEISKNEDEPSTSDKQITSTKDTASTRGRSSRKGKGIVIHSKERGIIRNVLRFCDREANINALLFPLKKAQRRAAVATGVSARTIVRIWKEALSNPPESRLRTPGKHRRKRKGTQKSEDNPDSSKNENPDQSDTSSDEEEKSGSDLSMDSADELSGDQEEDPPFVNPKWPATGEYVFKEGQIVDINFFVRCLRKANSHHDTLQCNLSDMFMYEEASKNGILGIIFRCRVCFMAIIVWTQDPNAKVFTLQPQATGLAANVPQKKTKMTSSPIPMDLISPKMRNLPKFLDKDQSVQSGPPLIGWPQVATVDKNSALADGGLNPPLEPASTKATVAELTFCVDQPESSPESGSVSVQSSDQSVSSTASPKSIYTHSALKDRLKSKATAKLAPKKSVTTSGVHQRPLRPSIGQLRGVKTLPLQPKINKFSGIRTTLLHPRIGQSIGVRVSSLPPRIVTSSSIITSTLQPKLIQSNTIMASTLQPRLNQSSGIMLSTLQPRLMHSNIQQKHNQSSSTMTSTLQPPDIYLNQSSGIKTPTLQPTLKQSSSMNTSTLQPPDIYNQSNSIKTSTLQPPDIYLNQSRGIIPSTVRPRRILASTMRPRLLTSTIRPRLNPASGILTSTLQPRLVQANGIMTSTLQPRILQSSNVRTSSTDMLNSPGIFIIQRSLGPQSFPSSGRETSSASMLKPEQIIQTAQRPLQSMLVQSSGPSTAMVKPEQIILTPGTYTQRPLQPRIVSSSSLRISPTAPEKIVMGQDVFLQRPLQPRIVGSTPGKILLYRNPPRPSHPGTRPIKPEKITITPDVFPHKISLRSSRSGTSSSTSVAPETIISDVSAQDGSRRSTETVPMDLNIVKMEFEEYEPRDTSKNNEGSL